MREKRRNEWRIEENMRSKQYIIRLLIIVVFLIGLGIFIYPTLSDYLAKRGVVQGASSYTRQVGSLSKEEIKKMWEEAETYNASLNGDPVPDPFIPGSGRILPENYMRVLATEDGIMGYVNIPKIGVYLPIFHGSSDEVLEKGAGHIEQTTLPIGGEGNLSVITAHTAYAGAEMFNRLIEVEEGDIFQIDILDKTLTYQVEDIRIILPEEIESLFPVDGRDYVTLVTCTPFGVNSHRLLVRGERIPNPPGTAQRIEKVAFPWKLLGMSAISIVIFSIMLVLNELKNSLKKK